MAHAIAGLDHVIIGVRDLEAAAARYRRLGFTLTPRGRHYGWGTANYCIMFGRDYVELLGIVDPAQFTNRLDEFLRRREGLLGLALATDDSAAVARSLAEAGIAHDGPKALNRAIELPEGEAMLRFALVMLPPETTPGLSAFVCQHLTPELMRRPEWLVHAIGATTIRSVTAAAESPQAHEQAHARLFGAAALVHTDATLTIHCGPHRMLVATPDDVALLHPLDDAQEQIETPSLVAMRIAVADADAAADYLDGAGVPYGRDADGTIRITPAETAGVILELGR